ncbi:hypothetical protein PsorP6_009873 [Peronosclerospora sorghi]|uniref:Uncharacterized protein n=1 Tax=Peronosclerospora sorghi TaxID=230839 RepID=A0ACC0W056_9STRA|nr:hypothetical protein PsorP6_009873 [Peronosclerospora sorghi]
MLGGEQELLSRQVREEMDALKKQYVDDLARNVSEQRTDLLYQLKLTFARESKAIEEQYVQRFSAVKEAKQQILTGEQK